MKYINTLFLLMLLTGLWSLPVDQDTQKEKPLYAVDLLKIKLAPEIAYLPSLPAIAYQRSATFGINELDQLLVVTGGIGIQRAHIQARDKAWQAKHGFDRWFVVKLDGKMSVEQAVKAFAANRFVEDARPEYLAYSFAEPNDPFYANNWGHANSGQLPAWNPPGSSSGSHSGAPVGWLGFDTDAPLAWDYPQGYGSQGVIVAVIDSGADLAHPDLALVTGYDYGDNDPDPTDINGHGTAVAGIVAGIADNGIGVAGVAGNVKVMPLKVMNSAGSMNFTSIANAVIHAADNGADIINLSLGSNTSVGANPAMDAALEYAYANLGVSIFASSGNSNASTVWYPANHSKVVAVGAAAPDGSRKSTSSADGEYWWGSNYGPATRDADNAIDIMGPTILPTTDITGSGGYTATEYNLYFNGTSCASPYVAGVAALLLSREPTLTPAQIRQSLTSSARDMTIGVPLGWDRFTGYGLVNARGALRAISAPPQVAWSPGSITQNLAPGQNASTAVQIGNGGENELDFTLSGVPITAPMLNESFESGGNYPAGWTSTVLSGIQHWIFSAGGPSGTNPTGSYSGAWNALLWQSGSTSSVARLASPSMDLSGVYGATLSFYHTQPYRFGQDFLMVQYKNSADGVWTTLAVYTESVVDWTQRTLVLPDLSSDYYIAFQGLTNQGWGISIDLVGIETITGYEVPWLKVEGDFSFSGSIPGGSSESVSVQIDATGLIEGVYNSNLLLQSNSATDPSILIPVQLNVGQGGPVLAAPQVSVSLSGNLVLLQWNAVSGASGYKIYKSASPDGSFVLLGTTSSLQYSEAAESGMAFYRVTAHNP